MLIKIASLIGPVPCEGRLNFESHQMIGLNAHIERFEVVQCTHKQARAYQHQDAQPNLDSDRDTAEAKRTGACSHRLLLQRRSQVWTPELQRRSQAEGQADQERQRKIEKQDSQIGARGKRQVAGRFAEDHVDQPRRDRKSTRLNSSHSQISYAVFCLKKKKISKQTSDNSLRNASRVQPRIVDRLTLYPGYLERGKQYGDTSKHALFLLCHLFMSPVLL